MNAALSAGTSAANAAENFALSRNKKPSCGGESETLAVRRWILDQRRHGLPLIRCECGNVYQSCNPGVNANVEESATSVTNRNGGVEHKLVSFLFDFDGVDACVVYVGDEREQKLPLCVRMEPVVGED